MLQNQGQKPLLFNIKNYRLAEFTVRCLKKLNRYNEYRNNHSVFEATDAFTVEGEAEADFKMYDTPEEEAHWLEICDKMNDLERLLSDIVAIDPEAVHYIIGAASRSDSFNPQGSLMKLFDWKETPQGGKYWAKINEKLIAAGGSNV